MDIGTSLPRHIGIIMDGNGRWATRRGLPRYKGHEEGLKATKRVVKAAAERGIPYLSLYTFSTENWKRAQEEVSFLMGLVRRYLKKEFDFYREYGIRIVHSGNLEGLPREIRRDLLDVIRDTASFTGLTLNIALNYGGRDEILRAMKRWLEEGGGQELTEESFRRYLDVPELPDPDLVIRTAGEQRLSNFLIWQAAYAEYYFTPVLWPDFSERDFDEALRDYASRTRKFGGTA
ncbi:Undecaprenyl pyrophosphate synthase [Spirochaeta thermophila DSM 6578]|uniref:Isoprenyl transferase n=1 Tax=Winmispira thermophila (strain ATCC 700085 / DSM 6578 / Z-1203) TaxID=869211 RepID=G0GBP5_WINT7|nr:polyprenyl diphosphate synthase [Spirochaeta thermophila]AEJ61123.1 Undecaprenyl pyrophosphate synthase [Spirochaeta thermophila DSM 6578]